MTADHPDVNALVDAIMRAQEADDAVAPRSRRSLARAARRGRILAAYRDAQPQAVGWVLVEPCTSRTAELGGLYVIPAHRDGHAFRAITRAALALRPRSIVVTMDARFADWLGREWHMRETTLWGATRASGGMFLLRRLAPGRVRAALRHATQGTPRYLILEHA